MIVVNQFLTGFDAPELNTLYVDRTLKEGNLIQAYSRTNRVHDREAKPWGNVINYRWPKQNEYEMNQAFAVYSNRASADYQLSLEELENLNKDSGIISKPFNEVKYELQQVISKLSDLTDNFTMTPPSERKQDEVFESLREFNRLVSQLKQYSEDENKNPVSAYDDPEEFYKLIGITEDQEIILTTVIANEVKRNRAEREDIDISQVNLSMVHIRDVKINYDYLIDLIAKMADEVHANQMNNAETTINEIYMEIAKSDNENEIAKVKQFVSKILSKEFVFDAYPAPRDVDKMNQALDQMHKDSNIQLITTFIRKWGLDNCVKPKELDELIQKHRIGQTDLNKQGEINKILIDAKDDYEQIAEDSIKDLSYVKYRNETRKAIYELADEIKKRE